MWAVGCACGQSVAACPSCTPSFVKDCGHQLMVFLSPQDLPTQHPSLSFPLTSSPPTLRPHQTTELWLLSNPTFSCPFPPGPMFFRLTHCFPPPPRFDLMKFPCCRLLYSLSNTLCPTVPQLHRPGKIPNLLEPVFLVCPCSSVRKDTRQASLMAPLEVEIPASTEAHSC